MLGLRTLRATAPLARQTIRQPLTRRYATETSGGGLKGAADNPFNREREAVKNHAAGTAGKILVQLTYCTRVRCEC